MTARAAALAAAAAVAAVATGAVLAGGAGAASAALGSIVVAVFFAAGAGLMTVTARLHPTLTTVLVLGGYAVQVLFLGVVVAALRDASWVSVPAFAVAAVAVMSAWLAGLMWAHVRTVRASRMRL